MAQYVHAYYVENFIRPEKLRANIDRVVNYLRDGGFEFDTIAFRGMSGATVAPAVALQMNKEIIMVRKGESNHSGYAVEGNTSARRVIIVDDLVSSGETARATEQGVKSIAPEAEVLGVIEYLCMDGSSYSGGKYLCTEWKD